MLPSVRRDSRTMAGDNSSIAGRLYAYSGIQTARMRRIHREQSSQGMSSERVRSSRLSSETDVKVGELEVAALSKPRSGA